MHGCAWVHVDGSHTQCMYPSLSDMNSRMWSDAKAVDSDKEVTVVAMGESCHSSDAVHLRSA